MADGHDLGSCAARRRGSSPRFPTNRICWFSIHPTFVKVKAIPTNKVETYRRTLQQLDNWEPYLLAESGLPGPRGNLELAQAVFEEGDAALFERFLEYTPDKAPVNSPEEFLHFCGVFGQGRHLSRDSHSTWGRLRQYAGDPRWRTREAVAMGLQAFGDRDMDGLLSEMEVWSRGSRFQQRAAAAGLCEPRLLKQESHAATVLHVIDIITSSIVSAGDRRDEGSKVLRQALGYCWSVAVVTLPPDGKLLMEKWFVSADPDIRRIMKNNLTKNRLFKMDGAWVERWRQELK